MLYSLLQTEIPEIAAAPVQQEMSFSLIEMASKGGVLMIVLLLLSIVAIYIFGQKWWTIRQAGKIDKDFMMDIRDYIHEGKIKSAKTLCSKYDSPIARMVETALARLGKGESIHELLHNGYSTISLGYAGLYECVKYMTNRSHTDNGVGKEFGLEVMRKLNDKCKEWKAAEAIDYSVYGSPIESTTYKFAKCLKDRFGVINGITDRDVYIFIGKFPLYSIYYIIPSMYSCFAIDIISTIIMYICEYNLCKKNNEAIIR